MHYALRVKDVWTSRARGVAYALVGFVRGQADRTVYGNFSCSWPWRGVSGHIASCLDMEYVHVYIPSRQILYPLKKKKQKKKCLPHPSYSCTS
eukprot:scaffold26767_cov78-Skeletonema_dohrnii-CCMP3373.AAC.1